MLNIGCAVCIDKFDSPVVLPCGHSFCEKHFTRDGVRECPHCRGPIFIRNYSLPSEAPVPSSSSSSPQPPSSPSPGRLRCPYCHALMRSRIDLPCGHQICLACARVRQGACEINNCNGYNDPATMNRIMEEIDRRAPLEIGLTGVTSEALRSGREIVSEVNLYRGQGWYVVLRLSKQEECPRNIRADDHVALWLGSDSDFIGPFTLTLRSGTDRERIFARSAVDNSVTTQNHLAGWPHFAPIDDVLEHYVVRDSLTIELSRQYHQ
eukprot:GHVN01087222.1.p1 GENE.GHVN01087222.1~~GHVN01087222.1.p1  ORF type:complete len:265 (+),score=18.54 GHVN01087222.1:125-919(+)